MKMPLSNLCLYMYILLLRGELTGKCCHLVNDKFNYDIIGMVLHTTDVFNTLSM